MSYAIAIDGPAGAGKSTIAKMAAKKLNFIYVDTGAMYRAIALYLLQEDIAAADSAAVEDALPKVEVTIAYEKGEQQVFLNGENVTDEIRNETVGNMASKAAAIPAVRKKLLELQRDLAAGANVIMDGRDIGTFVLPHAQLKIFLTASVSCRAKRRYDELAKKGVECQLAEIEADIRSRDAQDENREISPLRKAEDAIVVDSSNLDIDEVTAVILDSYEAKRR